MHKKSTPYKALCTEFYELDKPKVSEDALKCYLKYAEEAKGPILEPMCGTGRFLIPLLEKGYPVVGFDYSHHMLEICRKKCKEKKLTATLMNASFENCILDESYKLIYIPSGSFSCLSESHEIEGALQFIHSHLQTDGKFVFEIETLRGQESLPGIWKGRWVTKSDGSKIVCNQLASFCISSRIETVLCRYEHWEQNAIIRTEVEEFPLRLYEMYEMELLLDKQGFKVLNRYSADHYNKVEATRESTTILYECVKR